MGKGSKTATVARRTTAETETTQAAAQPLADAVANDAGTHDGQRRAPVDTAMTTGEGWHGKTG